MLNLLVPSAPSLVDDEVSAMTGDLVQNESDSPPDHRETPVLDLPWLVSDLPQ